MGAEGEQKPSERKAVNSSYCFWRDCARTPTQLTRKAKKPKDNDTEMGVNKASKKFQPNADINYYFALSRDRNFKSKFQS